SNPTMSAHEPTVLSMFTTYPPENGFLKVDTPAIAQIWDKVGDVIEGEKTVCVEILRYVVHRSSPKFLGIKKTGDMSVQFRMWFQYSVFIARISSPDRCHTMQ